MPGLVVPVHTDLCVKYIPVGICTMKRDNGIQYPAKVGF